MAIEGAAFSQLDARRQEQTPQALARLVVVVLFMALWTVLFIARIPMPFPFLVVLVLETLFFLAYLRVVPMLPSVRAVDAAQAIMLTAEILFHTTMVYFLGGITWLGAFAYVFGLIFANTFLDLRKGLLYTCGAALAFGSLIYLEATGTIPHQTYLDQGPLRYEDARFVATTAIGAGGVFFSIYLWVNWVGFQLRNERDAALRAQEGLLKARADLERANEELEERVLQRTAELEQANTALLENEGRLRTVIDNAPVVLFAIDREGVFTMSEGKGLAGLGLAAGEVVGLSVFDVYQDAPAVLEHVRRALTGETFSATVEVGRLSFETHYAPALDADGNVFSVIGIATDITERKLAEEALVQSEERYRSLTENTFDLICEVDAQARFSYVSPNYFEALGYAPGDLLGRNIFELIHEEDRDGVVAEFAKALGSQSTGQAVFRYRDSSGAWRWFESTGRAFETEAGETRAAIVSRDITERRAAEEALRELKRQNELVLNSAGEGIYGVDLEGCATFVNPAAAHMLGWEQDELFGRPLHDVLHHSHPDGTPYPKDECPIYAAFRDNETHTVGDEVFWKKDGTPLPVEYISTPIRDERGVCIGAVVTFNDVTERKAAEEALRRSEEVLRRTIESTDDGILVIGTGTGVLHMNTRFGDLWDLPGELRETTHPRDFIQHLVDRTVNGEAILETLREAYRTGEEHIETLEIRDGRLFEMYSRALLRDGAVEGRVFSFRDVTERKAAEDALRQSEAKFRAMAETVAAAVFIFQGTKMCYVNSAAESTTGYTREELLEMEFWDVMHPDYRDLVRERGMARQRGERVPGRYEVKIVTKRGQERWVDFTAGVIDYEGQPAVLGTAFDVTERRRAEEALREHANRDPLTRLLNRRAGLAAIEERLQIARIEGRPFAVLVLDLDKFKSINDTYSHETGDNALLQFSRVMSDLVGDKGVLTRLGGDEFEIGLDGIDAEEAYAFAERIQDGLRESFESAGDGGHARFTVSIGIACYPRDGELLVQLGREADKAMYHAKSLGGAQTCTWQDVGSDRAA